MIYLITGNMGTGKTSRVVNMILTNEDGLFTHTLSDGSIVQRPLYFCHIDGFDAKKFNAHELIKEEIQAAPLDKLLPMGAMLIVDEAHWVYPVRAVSSTVPEYIQKLTELRHKGYTLILVTQHPLQLDTFVQNLVSKHIHIERKSLGMKEYRWYKCITDLSNPAEVAGVESSTYTLPKASFKYYQSASQHQKFKKNIPLSLIVLIVIIAFVIWKGINIYGSYRKAIHQENKQEKILENEMSSGLNSDFYRENKSITNGHLTADLFVPTLSERPESKPLYDNIRQVQQFERVAGCVLGGESGCTCYSDQATELKEITASLCKKYAIKGLPFDPFKETTVNTYSQSTKEKEGERVKN